ncbi:MAG TPA: ZIP family metal transporter, partial [Candidatus Hydrogenedentes bacterium]|nr:ZIP family metal transporter [Candidatus Hydrogenedentota bacterium]
MQALAELHPVWQAFLATMFTWFMTSAGAVPVFFTKEVNPKVMDGLLGMAAGVMIAASFWSLLAPAITLSEDMGYPGWGPPLVGFLAGGAALWGIDKLLPHLHPGLAMS